MKNNIRGFILFFGCLLMALGIRPVAAQLKLGASETAGAAVGGAQESEKNVQNKLKEAADKKQEEIIGPKTKVKIEKFKAMKEDMASAATEIKDSYSGISENTSAIQSGISEMSGEINSEIDNAKGEVDKVKGSAVGMTVDLSAQLADVNKQIENRKTAVLKELTAKAQAAQDNYATLQAMYDTAENEADKAIISSEMETVAKDVSEYNTTLKQFEEDEGETYLADDSEYQALIDQRNGIAAQLAASAAASAEFMATAIGNLLSKSDAEKQEEYNKVINDNFLKKDEANTAENVARIMKHRQEVLKKDITHVLRTTVALKQQSDQDLERIKTKQSNTVAADYKLTAANMLVEQKIEDINILYNYTNLLIADLRLKTSQNMLNQDHRLKNYDKNPAVLNLDNYIFTEDDVPSDEGQTSFLDSVTAK